MNASHYRRRTAEKNALRRKRVAGNQLSGREVPAAVHLQRALQRPGQAGPEAINQLQRLYGNKHVTQLLRAPAGPAHVPTQTTPTVQREYGPLPTDPKARDREIRRRIRLRKEKEKQAKYGWFGSETMLGKAAGWFSSTRSGEGDMAQHESNEYNLGNWEETATEREQDEAQEKQEEAEFFNWKKIKITLIEVDEVEKQSALGTAKAKGNLQANLEGFEGEAELEIESGSGAKFVDKDFDWKIGGGKLGGHSDLEYFGGAKGGAKLKGSVGANEQGYSAAASGKASAFIGGALTGKTEVSVVSSAGEKLTTAKAELGVTWGVGGEFSFKISWENGTFSAGGQAKAAAGWGFSAGYNFTINTQPIARGLWRWIASYWSE